ncbi:MAG TPA: ParB/RepB/Spo0J family partition protein [Herpetosiphonaceae bacterium]
MQAIRTTPQNPRAADTALDDLIASLAVESEPYLAQPPLVEHLGEREYRLIAGERRVRAVTAAGWATLACLVYPRLDPAQAHELRLIENLHRAALDALDEACALRIAWFRANADALGTGDAAREILGQEQAPAETLAQLGALLATVNFTPTRPAVTWDQVLDRLGLDLSPAQRKRRMRLLSLDSAVQAQARVLDLSPAAMRAIGTLAPEQQQRLIGEVAQDPRLARKIRRIASTVTKGTYTLDQALDEARGRVRFAAEREGSAVRDQVTAIGRDDDLAEAAADDDANAPTPADGESAHVDQAVIDAVMELINVASSVTTALVAFNTAVGTRSIAALGEPWGGYAQYALALLRDAATELPGYDTSVELA